MPSQQPHQNKPTVSGRRVVIVVVCLFLSACAGEQGVQSDAAPTGVTTPAVDAAPTRVETDTGDSQVPADSSCASADRVSEDIGIPTLDGYELSAFVDRPAGEPCPLPTILLQTPYDKDGSRALFFGSERQDRPLYASPHYNFVVVDWRGRFGSNAVPVGDGTWNAQDGYTNVEWIADQPWSDGQVAMIGVSALCGQQYRTAMGPLPTAAHPEYNDGPPPSLKAMVPIMCPIGADFERTYPGGVLRHEWASALDVLGFGVRSLYENNPRQNLLWTILGGAQERTANIAVPALVVGGWWDVVPTETVEAFDALVTTSDPSVRDQHRLLMGPWIHFATGGEASSGAVRPLTDGETAYVDLDRRIDADALAFFDHHLRGVDNAVTGWERVRYYQTGEGWTGSDVWPPAANVATSFYAGVGQTLSTSAPGTASSAEVGYDANDPSPTAGGATLSPYNCLGSETPLLCTLTPQPEGLLVHGPTSQAAVLARDDSIMFATEPLRGPLALTGEGTVYVDVSTTLADADVAVRVVDIFPDGTPLLIGEGIARISSWANPTTWAPVSPGTRVALEVPLNAPLGYTLATGHQLGLILAGSNWPLYARNPGTGAVFHEDDVAPTTKGEFMWGLPTRTLDLQSPGSSGVLRFYLDGTTRFEVDVSP